MLGQLLKSEKLKCTIMPKILFAVAVIALPVPLSFVGNNSGVRAYSTPYMTLLVKL